MVSALRQYRDYFFNSKDSENQPLLGQPQEKMVLKLEGHQLRFVPLKDTSLFERVLKWFGFGPLSLKNIVGFITANAEIVKKVLALSEQKNIDLINKLSGKCRSYNAHHYVSKVNVVAFESLFCPLSFSQKDTTYGGAPEANCDNAYADGRRGFGYASDGTGHNNPLMAGALNKIFTEFNQGYEQAFDAATLNTVKDYISLVKSQLEKLGTRIHNDPTTVNINPKQPGLTHMSDPTLKPALSFAQVAKIGEKRLLISAEFSDTMLLIKKADGTFDTSLVVKRENHGIGDSLIPVGNVLLCTEVGLGDVIYGFSDGIGEFLTMAECQEVISANPHPATLLNAFKEKIIAKGLNHKPDTSPQASRDTTRTANGAYIKYHKPDDRKNHDDICIFSLRVT